MRGIQQERMLVQKEETDKERDKEEAESRRDRDIREGMREKNRYAKRDRRWTYQHFLQTFFSLQHVRTSS